MPGQTKTAGGADKRPAAPIPTKDKSDSALVALVRYLARTAAERDYQVERGGTTPPQAEPEGTKS